MKKIMVILLALCPVLAFADARISYDELPEKAKTFVSAHFKDFPVLYVEHDVEDKEYEVNFGSDADITFDLQGNWTKIDPGNKKLAESVLAELPKAMADYLTKEYSLKSISEIRRWSSGYEVEIEGLFDDTDLYFDQQGRFTGKER